MSSESISVFIEKEKGEKRKLSKKIKKLLSME
jgi:hypothetical protein